MSFENVLLTRFFNGNMGMLFYNIKIVNSIGESVTIKDVIVRYELNGKQFRTDSYALQTGEVISSEGTTSAILITVSKAGKAANIGLERWTNLREELGTYKLLPPGGVLEGSAAFILSFQDADQFSKLKEVEIVVTDYSGNETIKRLTIPTKWIDDAKNLNSAVESRKFSTDGGQNITYSK